MSKLSYQSANSYPIKLLRHDLNKPLHIQLYPTNRCNHSCSFCSYCNRDSSEITDYKSIINYFANHGTQSCTISGGGEPLLHPHINDIIQELLTHNIQVGIATNGDYIDKLKHDVTWIRVSCSDEYEFNFNINTDITTDWAFSYVVTKGNIDNINKVLKYADNHNFTHVRLVSDIFNPKPLPDIEHPLLIRQSRTTYTHGMKYCKMPIIKPIIGADEQIYPCCGIQYAHNPPSRKLVNSMCHWSEWHNIEYFDGSNCVKCYYNKYNELLNLDIKHREFV